MESTSVSRPRPSNARCIGNFPDEISIEIFTYLSANDLKRLMMISHVFRDLVGQSSKLMKKFLLKISPKRKWDFESLADFERVHQNVKMMEFKTESDSLNNVIDGVVNFGANVKHFEMNDCEVSVENFLTVLSAMKHLTRVNLINVNIADDQGHVNQAKLPEFKHLTHLKVVECNSVFEIFQRCEKLYEICFQADERKNINLKWFEVILHNQKKLNILELSNIRFSNFLEQEAAFPFQLESLTVQHCHFNEKKNFEEFLKNQKQLAEVEMAISNLKLNLDRIRYFEDSIAIVIKFKHLKKLTIEIGNYELSMFFLSQCLNENVQNLTLILEGKPFSIVSILKIFPNIETLALSVKDIDEESVNFINQNLNKLQNFKVSKFSSSAFAKLKFKNLKSLHVNETNIEADHWMVFLENNQKIIKLIINFTFFVDLSEDFIEKVTKKLKLEHFELIDKWIGMSNEIYMMICENCENLRYLKLHNINIEKNFDEKDKSYLRSKNVKFYLYNDESLNTAMIPF